MGIRANGNFAGQIVKLLQKWEDFDKKLVKQQGFREQNVLFRETGSSKTLLTIREQMGIRTNGKNEPEFLVAKTKMGSHLFASVL